VGATGARVPRPRSAASALAAWALTLASCDLAPPSGDAVEGPRVVGTWPADGAEGVPRAGELEVRFDRRVLPRSVSRGTVYVESGPVRPLSSVRYDVVRAAAYLAPFDGRPLEAGVVYRLVVDGVEDVYGVPMRAPVTVRFRTGEALGDPPAPPPRAGWDAARVVLVARCASVGCHAGDRPAVGLALDDAAGVRATAIGRIARTAPALGAEGGAGAPALAGLPIIDVLAGEGRPETSWLVYGILRDARLPVSPMPPDAALSPEERDTLVAWIRAGAPTF
jgi:cytochrome c551/c552